MFTIPSVYKAVGFMLRTECVSGYEAMLVDQPHQWEEQEVLMCNACYLMYLCHVTMCVRVRVAEKQ